MSRAGVTSILPADLASWRRAIAPAEALTDDGSPIGCAAALAVLSVIREERLLERAVDIGRRVRAVVAPLQAQGTVPICNLRGLGAMLAFDAADAAAAKRLVARALERGLLLLTCGGHGETVRLLMPLTIPDADLTAGLEILAEAIRKVAS